MGFYAVSLLRGVAADRALFARGAPAVEGTVGGEERSQRFVLHTYDLTLTYVDQAGVKRTAHQEIETVGGTIDDQATPEIRYDPASPDRAVCSWSLDVTPSRVAWGVLAGLLALLGGFVAYAGARGLREAFLERDAARDGREVRARVTEKGRDQYGNVTFEVTAEPAPGEVLTRKVVLNRRSPWMLGEGVALGLYSDQLRRVFLVESDGQPVVLDEGQLAEARARASASVAGG
jgi:hypothetical protein